MKRSSTETAKEEGCEDVFVAHKSGDWKQVEQILEHRPECVNARNEDNQTLLMLELRNAKRVRYLLNLGCDPNASCNNGDNALIIAAKQRAHIEIFKRLVDKGASLHSMDATGKPAIAHIIECFSNNINEIEVLLCGGIDHDEHFNCTSFMSAVAYQYKHIYIAKLLMNAGCNPLERDGKNRTAIMMLFKRFHPISHKEYITCDDHKYFLPMLQFLIEVGCDINDLDDESNTALDYLLDNHDKRTGPPCSTNCNCKTCTMVSLANCILTLAEKSQMSIDAKWHPQRSLIKHVSRLEVDDLEQFFLRIIESPLLNPRFKLEVELSNPNSRERTIKGALSFYKLCCRENLEVNFDTIDFFIEALFRNPPLLKKWIDCLLAHSFILNYSDSDEAQVVSPLMLLVVSKSLVSNNDNEHEYELTDLLKYLIEKGADVSHMLFTRNIKPITLATDLSMNIEIPHERQNFFKKHAIPDALWAATITGKIYINS
jgi:ankyrin repeat protein